MSLNVLYRIMEEDFGEAFTDDDVTEISVNKPGEFFVAKKGCAAMVRHENPNLTYARLKSFVSLVAATANQKINETMPLLSAQIQSLKYPDLYYRVQVVHDPAVYTGRIALSIRKPLIVRLDYEVYREMFSNVKTYSDMTESDKLLAELYRNQEFWQFLKLAVQVKKTVLISAGTDSGKTTLFNSLIELVDPKERIITIEDSKELDPPHENTLQLYYSRGRTGRRVRHPPG